MDRALDTGVTNAAAFRALPDEAPLTMPTQSLRIAPERRGRLPTEPRLIGTRRTLVIGAAVAMTVEATHEMYRVLAVNGPTVLAIVMLALFVALFAWIALSFTSALAGILFAAVWRRAAPADERPDRSGKPYRAADADL